MTTHVSKALNSLSKLDQRVLGLLLVMVGFLIIFRFKVREGIIEVQIIVIRRASSWMSRSLDASLSLVRV